MNLGTPKTIGGLRIAFGLASNFPHAGRLAPMAQERGDQRPHGLVRITWKKACADGTVVVDMDPLSLL